MAFRTLCSLILAALVVTHTSAEQCRLTRHGGAYGTFYEVESLTHMINDSNVVFEMHVAIQGQKDAHILLSPILEPTKNDSVYEIEFGAGSNTYSELRRKMKGQSLASDQTSNILSATELRPFNIKIYKDGLIEISKEGDDKPLISYTDKNPLQIKYLTFASYTDLPVVFVYNCKESNPTASTMLLEPSTTVFTDYMTDTEENETTDSTTTDFSIEVEESPTTESSTTESTSGNISTEEVTTEINKSGEFTTNKPIDSQKNVTDASNQNKDEHPHIHAIMEIDPFGTVRASLGPLTRNETSLVSSFGILIAAIAKELHGGFGPARTPVNRVTNNGSPYAPYVAFYNFSSGLH